MLYWCFSFWLTALCIIGFSFIHLIRTDSNAFFFNSWVISHLFTFTYISCQNNLSRMLVSYEVTCHISFKILLKTYLPKVLPSISNTPLWWHTQFRSSSLAPVPTTLRTASHSTSDNRATFPFLIKSKKEPNMRNSSLQKNAPFLPAIKMIFKETILRGIDKGCHCSTDEAKASSKMWVKQSGGKRKATPPPNS